jgi:hypothetical protein
MNNMGNLAPSISFKELVMLILLYSKDQYSLDETSNYQKIFFLTIKLLTRQLNCQNIYCFQMTKSYVT